MSGFNVRTNNINVVNTPSVALSGSSLIESQALPSKKIQKDIAMTAYENIINTIGMENIALFLPMWEESGTEFKDILHPEVTFVAEGPTLAQQGVLHLTAKFDGINDYARQKPMTEWITGSATFTLDNVNKKIAQKLKTNGAVQGKVKFVTFKLQRIGSPAGTLQVRIVEDSSGQPTGTLVQTSVSLDVTSITTSGPMTIGLPFSVMGNVFGLSSKRYWVIIEYATATTVDASNYISVTYDSAGGYGEPLATYDGTSWTVQSSQSMVFAAYNNALDLTNTDFSIITCHILNSQASYNTLAQLPGGYGVIDSGNLAAMYLACSPYSGYVGNLYFGHVGDGLAVVDSFQNQVTGRPEVLVGTFSKAKSTGKVTLYRNSRLLATGNGTADKGANEPYHPMLLGTYIHPGTRNTYGGYFNGVIGPVIVVKSELTQTQISNITNQLYALQRRGGV